MHIEFYNSQRLDFIKQLLISSVENSKAPQDYEIRVDDMRVVPRTNNPELFDNYEDFITDQTRSVLVMLYEGISRKNTKYMFKLKEEDMPKAQEKGLGEIEVAKIVKEKLEQREQQIKQEQMEKENKEMKKQIQQNEEEMEKAAEVIKKLKENRDLEDMQWGKIFGEVGNTLLKNNTKFLAQLPGMKGLAGIIEADNKAQQQQISNQQPDVEASYTMKTDQNENEKKEESEKKENESVNKNSQANEEERDRLGLIRQLQQRFEEKEVRQIFSLLNLLANNPKAIEPTLNSALQQKAQSSPAKSEATKAENKKPEPQFKKHTPNPETKQQGQAEEKEKIKPEQKQENSSEEENCQDNNPEEQAEESEPTNFPEHGNQKKENDFNELPVTM